ncbi:hypothetical protein [Halorubrum tebenquichense]|uniref:hypothetical protein n=1 Tax=Halorubrum tebenquichense TaxID=119434 RepID=UPI001268B13C|nr:hypothetical protein [Halorubrum tebenquichense]
MSLYERFLEFEGNKQPELRTLKNMLITGVVSIVGVYTGLSISNIISLHEYQPAAAVFGVTIFILFVLLVIWRPWEFVKYEM